jgi:oligopeptide/dipeptide ABC transporter ATP-binding protein
MGEAVHLLSQVGLEASLLDRYPSEVSAGQLQKASMARALATRPRMIFLDEPTAALDASGRRQILDLLLTLQSKPGLGYVLVSHDFHAIGALAHHLVVMYLGQVVEEGPAAEVLKQPLHPYTRALLVASDLGSSRQSSWRIRGELSQLPHGYQGCKLYSRCPYAVSGCRELQTLIAVRPQQSVCCWRAVEIASQSDSSGKKSEQN